MEIFKGFWKWTWHHALVALPEQEWDQMDPKVMSNLNHPMIL